MKISYDKNLNHITSTGKKAIKAAYEYCLENNVNRCKASKWTIEFNFTENTGWIRHGGWGDKFSFVVA